MAASLSKVWKIKDKGDMLRALGEYLDEKCDYGENIEELSSTERIFSVMQYLEMEVNNGGFNQFFFNSSGNFADEIVNVCEEIGADATAEICKKALDALGELPEVGTMEREEVLDELLDSDEVNEILEECDEAFYEYEDDLEELCYEYVMDRQDHFS